MRNKGRRDVGSFQARLASQETLLGSFVKIPAPEIIELYGYAGFDFIIIDMEHTTLSFRDVEQMVRVADLHGMHTIVRVDYNESSILKALDLGATGIQVPQVDTPEQARAVERKAKYPPAGSRGATLGHRAASYGNEPLRAYLGEANANSVIVVHVETASAYENIEGICQVAGIDVVFIGPMDLSISLGVDMDFMNGGLAGPLQRVIEVCRRYGKAVGLAVNNLSEYQFAVLHGITYMVWGSDIGLIKSAFNDVRKKISGQ